MAGTFLCIGLSFVNRIPLFAKYTTLFITVQPSVIGRNDLCLHKDQTALLRMCRAPDNEQRSGVSRGAVRQRGFANGAGGTVASLTYWFSHP